MPTMEEHQILDAYYCSAGYEVTAHKKPLRRSWLFKGAFIVIVFIQFLSMYLSGHYQVQYSEFTQPSHPRALAHT